MQLCHHSNTPIYLLFRNLKELVTAETNESMTQYPVKPHWVAVLTNILMIQNWVKICISNTAKCKPSCESFSNFIFYNVCWVFVPFFFFTSFFILYYFILFVPLSYLYLWSQDFDNLCQINFCLRDNWIRAVLGMGTIIVLKKLCNTKVSKRFQNTISNYNTVILFGKETTVTAGNWKHVCPFSS